MVFLIPIACVSYSFREHLHASLQLILLLQQLWLMMLHWAFRKFNSVQGSPGAAMLNYKPRCCFQGACESCWETWAYTDSAALLIGTLGKLTAFDIMFMMSLWAISITSPFTGMGPFTHFQVFCLLFCYLQLLVNHYIKVCSHNI